MKINTTTTTITTISSTTTTTTTTTKTTTTTMSTNTTLLANTDPLEPPSHALYLFNAARTKQLGASPLLGLYSLSNGRLPLLLELTVLLTAILSTDATATQRTERL